MSDRESSIIDEKRKRLQELLNEESFAETLESIHKKFGTIHGVGYSGPYHAVGKASFLIEDIRNLGQNTTAFEEKLRPLVRRLEEFAKTHEGVGAYVLFELGDKLNHAEGVLSEMEVAMQLPHHELQEDETEEELLELIDEFENCVLDARGTIESVLKCFAIAKEVENLALKGFRKRVSHFDESLRTLLPGIVGIFNMFEPGYRRSETVPLYEALPSTFWWHRIKTDDEGRVIWY